MEERTNKLARKMYESYIKKVSLDKLNVAPGSATWKFPAWDELPSDSVDAWIAAAEGTIEFIEEGK